MQKNNGQQSSKGKEKDLVDRFDGLGLYQDDSIPRTSMSSTSYGQLDSQDWSPSYHGEEYTHTRPGQPTSSGYYDNSFFATQRSSNPQDSYTGLTTNLFGDAPPSQSFSYGPPSSYTSSNYTRSHGSSSHSSRSYAPSRTSSVSTHPPRFDPNNLDYTIAAQVPASNQYHLPCEFSILTNCTANFRDGEERDWKEHHERHLNHKFPTKLKCWFCDTFVFDANDYLSGGDKRHNFEKRMDHIRDHIIGEGYQAGHMRPDGSLIRHLKHERIISSQEYNDILARLNPPTAPPLPGGSSSRPLEQVREEPASASRDKRHERKDKHESSKKKHHKK